MVDSCRQEERKIDHEAEEHSSCSKDIEKSRQFYHELFGLQTVLNSEGNMILTEGLVLQDEKNLERSSGKGRLFLKIISASCIFEEPEIEAFICKLETQYPSIQYVNRLTEYSWGQKMVRFYDLDGNLIEVRTPMYKRKAIGIWKNSCRVLQDNS